MGDNNKICRLCLQMNYSNIQISDIKNIFDVLPPALTVSNIGANFVVCKSCLENIDKLSNFKSMLLNTQQSILSYAKYTSLMKPDIKLIYTHKKGSQNITDLPQNHNVCRFCIELTSNDLSTSLDDKQNEVVLLKKILEKYFTELDLDLTTNPIICASCKISLQSYFDFINNCLHIAERNKNKYDALGMNTACQQNLRDIKEFALKDALKFEIDFCDPNPLKKEVLDTEVAGDVSVTAEVKQEETSSEYNLPDGTFQIAADDVLKGNNYMNQISYQIINFNDFKEDLVKSEEFSNTTRIDVGENEVHFKSEEGNIEIGETVLKGSEVNGCLSSPEEEDMLRQKDDLENTSGPFKLHSNDANRTLNKKKRKSTNKKISYLGLFKCDQCTYKSKFRGSLNHHMLIHKDPSELTMYKCTLCTFETKYKDSLRKHSYLHQNLSEVPTYKCPDCDFKTKRKYYIGIHMLVHRKKSEVTMYKCAQCQYETKYKNTLKNHELIHRSPLERRRPLFTCEVCNFKSKYKGNLKIHNCTHIWYTDGGVYKCDKCSFQSIRIKDFTQHMLVHNVSKGQVISNITKCKNTIMNMRQRFQAILKNAH